MTERKFRTSVVTGHTDMSFGEIVEHSVCAAKTGVDGLWLSQLPNQRDVCLLLASIASHVADVTIGTAILPIYQSPPVVMAQAAMTLDEICGGRLVLGLGRGHRLVGEWILGGKYALTTAPVREYLTIVTSLIREGEANMVGSAYEAHAFYGPPRRPSLPVYLAALGPRMLELAGEIADGVILWMCTPTYIHDVVMPSLRAGWARRAGDHTGFEVVAMVPAVATPHPEQDREHARGMLSGYMRLENYKKVLIASGFDAEVKALRPSDAMIDALCAIGSGQMVRERLDAFRTAGVTEIAVAPLVTERFAATVEAALPA